MAIRKSYPLAFLLWICLTPIVNLSQSTAKISFEANEVRPHSNYKPTEVLLLGVFHFAFPNLDGHKVDSSLMFDVLHPSRQQELATLISTIKEFKPTKIYVEARNQNRLDSIYNAYVRGLYQLGRSELFQIGFRLAKELKHKKVYAVDANNFAMENAKKYRRIDSFWVAPEYIDTVGMEQWDAAYRRSYQIDDSLAISKSLIETLLMTSHPYTWNRLNGHQLVCNVATRDNKGPDAVALQWYDRNLRIFNNILRSAPFPGERVLVLFGAGHMSVLHHLFESSPQFRPVLLSELFNIPKQRFKPAGKVK